MAPTFVVIQTTHVFIAFVTFLALVSPLPCVNCHVGFEDRQVTAHLATDTALVLPGHRRLEMHVPDVPLDVPLAAQLFATPPTLELALLGSLQ